MKKQRPFEITDELKARLGKEPDNKIARDIGMSHSWVRLRRTELGIPSFGAWTDRTRCPPDVRKMLKEMPDSKIIEKTGISKTYLRRWREELGIKIWTEGRKQMSLWVPLDLLESITAMAFDKNTTNSEIIIGALTEWLDCNEES